jgi:hypothetical protein
VNALLLKLEPARVNGSLPRRTQGSVPRQLLDSLAHVKHQLIYIVRAWNDVSVFQTSSRAMFRIISMTGHRNHFHSFSPVPDAFGIQKTPACAHGYIVP